MCTGNRPSVSDQAFTLGIVVSMLLWGLSWPSSKVLTRFVSPVNLVGYRYFLVVLTLIPMVLLGRAGFWVKSRGIPAILASGALLALYSYFFFLGLKLGSAGAGGVLVTTLNPIAAYAIGMLLDRRLPSRFEGIGLILGALAGCILLKVWDHPTTILDRGNRYFLLAALTWSVMSKITSRSRLYGHSLSFSLWQYAVTLACLVPFVRISELKSTLHISDYRLWLNLFFSATIVTAVATTIYFYATTRVGAERASSFIFIVPLAAALSAWALLGEHILPHTIAGGVLGVAAVYMINRKRKES